MTISSRKYKNVLPVRLGIEPDNKTALKELGMDPALADKKNGYELDMMIIDHEFQRIKKYYGDHPEKSKYADDWKREAIKAALNGPKDK